MKDTLLVMGGAAAGTLAVAALLLGLRASADGLQTSSQVPKLLAWHGTLEKDGAAVDGTVQMTFALLDGAAATTPAWSEVQSVPVFGGRFSVLLGATSAAKQDALAATVRAADDLYLRVSVLDGESWVPLSSPTRFVPVPYSHWTMAGTDISANGVDGLQSGGKLFLNYHTKADTQVEGNLQIYGPGLRFLSHPERGDGGTALSHGTSDRLFLNEGVGLAGGTLIQGALSASPALITFDRYQMGAANLHDTGKSTADWACFIGGASFGSGDIFENGTGTLLTLHTYRNTTTSTWWVRMDFISHPVHEPHDVGVVCLRKGLFNIVTYWTGT